MLKSYTVTPSASTETNLVAAVATGKAVVVDNLLITAVTAAEVELRIHNGTSVVHVIPLIIDAAGDTVIMDNKITLPAGYALKVISDQADTTFTTGAAVETENV